MRGGLKAQLYRTAQGKRSGALGSHKHMGKRSQATLRVRAMRMVCYFEHRSHRSHGFLSHAEGKRLRGHQCMRGGLKAQLHRTAQGKRSGALGSHCAPANRHSRPARAGAIGEHHQSPIRTPTACCVIPLLLRTRHVSSNALHIPGYPISPRWG